MVDEPAAGRALTDLTLLPLVAHFLRHEASASEAAVAIGADLDEVYDRVRKLAGLGLLEVTSVERRAGRPIKRYRAAAQAFFVPFAVLPHETLAHALVESARLPEHARAEGAARALLEMSDDPYAWGFRLDVDGNGSVHAFWGPREGAAGFDVNAYLLEPDKPPIHGMSATLHLTRNEAKALQRELHDLGERWLAVSRRNRREGADGPARDHHYGVGLAPDAG